MARISISKRVADLLFDLITAEIEAGQFSQADADALGEFRNRMSRAVAREQRRRGERGRIKEIVARYKDG